jgi:hypothetical protein
VDEYGNPNLATETAGVSRYFILSVVIVPALQLDDVRTSVEAVRKAVFQTGKMKSARVGKNRQRWQMLLASLSPIPFKFYALAVNKDSITKTSGLKWKGSFYKHLCGRAYDKVMRAYPDLHVRADQYGRSEFQESFASYIRLNHRPTLFDRGTFDFVDGKTDVLVQLADIICGVLARCYDPDMRLTGAAELLGLIRGQALLVDEWPPMHRLTSTGHELKASSEVDGRVAQYSLGRAEEFVVENEDSPDEVVRCQVGVLEQLLLECRLGSNRYVLAANLIKNLEDRMLEPKGEAWFRLSVIAGLRDAGVLVAGSSAGYKLPTSEADLEMFARHAEGVCVPLLRRVQAACDAIKLTTRGQIDILAKPEMATLGGLLGAVDARTKVPPEQDE